jgi:hypothetical protein
MIVLNHGHAVFSSGLDSVNGQPLDLSSRSSEAVVRLARAYSDVVSPPTVFAALGIAVAQVGAPVWSGLVWGVVHGVLVSVAPILFILHMLKTGRIADLHIRNRRERHLPYLVGTGCSLIALIIAQAFGASRQLRTLMVSNVVGLAALGIVNAFWQISSHVASITSAALFTGFVFGPPVSIALAPFVVLTFLARLFLKRHTVGQLVAGLGLGAAPVLTLASLGLLN